MGKAASPLGPQIYPREVSSVTGRAYCAAGVVKEDGREELAYS